MAAPKGNRFWEARSRHGRKRKWEDPELLREACFEYIQWVIENPLGEHVTYKGIVQDEPVPRMRAMSIGALSVFLGITIDTWIEYRSVKDFSDITREIDQIIYNQKFEGASAGFLKENIIARDLGLADKQNINHGGQKDNPVKVDTTLSPDEAYLKMIGKT